MPTHGGKEWDSPLLMTICHDGVMCILGSGCGRRSIWALSFAVSGRPLLADSSYNASLSTTWSLSLFSFNFSFFSNIIHSMPIHYPLAIMCTFSSCGLFNSHVVSCIKIRMYSCLCTTTSICYTALMKESKILSKYSKYKIRKYIYRSVSNTICYQSFNDLQPGRDMFSPPRSKGGNTRPCIIVFTTIDSTSWVDTRPYHTLEP